MMKVSSACKRLNTYCAVSQSTSLDPSSERILWSVQILSTLKIIVPFSPLSCWETYGKPLKRQWALPTVLPFLGEKQGANGKMLGGFCLFPLPDFSTLTRKKVPVLFYHHGLQSPPQVKKKKKTSNSDGVRHWMKERILHSKCSLLKWWSRASETQKKKKVKSIT